MSYLAHRVFSTNKYKPKFCFIMGIPCLNTHDEWTIHYPNPLIRANDPPGLSQSFGFESPPQHALSRNNLPVFSLLSASLIKQVDTTHNRIPTSLEVHPNIPPLQEVDDSPVTCIDQNASSGTHCSSIHWKLSVASEIILGT